MLSDSGASTCCVTVTVSYCKSILHIQDTVFGVRFVSSLFLYTELYQGRLNFILVPHAIKLLLYILTYLHL
jgi:hypothetical protein